MSIGNCEFLPAPITGEYLARQEIRSPRFDDFSDSTSDHHLADADGIGVGTHAGHASAHIGIDGEILRAQEHLPLGERRQRLGDEFEVRFFGHAHGAHR